MELYLDNHSATQPMPFVAPDLWASPLVPHQLGQRSLPAMTQAYEDIYDFIGAPNDASFVLTSSIDEAVNQAIFSAYLTQMREEGRNHFITSSVDEASHLLALERLSEFSCTRSLADVDEEGYVTAEKIAEVITPRTAMVSMTWANGMTGIVNPVEEIAELCQDRGVLLHLDASHILGKYAIELQDIQANFISFDANAWHGPTGCGGLFALPGTELRPFILGGAEQAGLRGGQVSLYNLCATGAAAKEAAAQRDFVCTETSRLRDHFEAGLFGAELLFQDHDRLPNVSLVSFPGISSDALLYHLNQKQVYASFGGGRFQQLGLLLQTMGYPPEIAQSALHFSLSRNTSEAEVDEAIERISQAVKDLQGLSLRL